MGIQARQRATLLLSQLHATVSTMFDTTPGIREPHHSNSPKQRTEEKGPKGPEHQRNSQGTLSPQAHHFVQKVSHVIIIQSPEQCTKTKIKEENTKVKRTDTITTGKGDWTVPSTRGLLKNAGIDLSVHTSPFPQTVMFLLNRQVTCWKGPRRLWAQQNPLLACSRPTRALLLACWFSHQRPIRPDCDLERTSAKRPPL